MRGRLNFLITTCFLQTENSQEMRFSVWGSRNVNKVNSGERCPSGGACCAKNSPFNIHAGGLVSLILVLRVASGRSLWGLDWLRRIPND